MYSDLNKMREHKRQYDKAYKVRKANEEKLRRETNIRRIAAAIVAVELSQKQE